MSATIPRVMHLVSARGGGSSRFARDLAQAGAGSWLLHVEAGTAVVEQPGEPGDFIPYRIEAGARAAQWLQTLLRAYPSDLLHVHFMDRTTLALLEAWCPLGQPWVLSIHDLGFLSATTFDQTQSEPQANAEWLSRWRAVMASAVLITVPSAYLANVFAGHCPDLPVHVVAPGVCLPQIIPTKELPLRTIAVVGALGPHKGKERLLRWLRHAMGQRYRWVLLGYTDDQLHPGSSADERLWIHGPFAHQDTARWLHHYQADLVLFPNRLAESFSYALSDVWAAGVPVLVPAIGALAARVGEHGGGAVLGDPDNPDAVARELGALEDGAQLGCWRTQIRSRMSKMVPSLETMVEQMTRLYPAPVMAQPHPNVALAELQPYLRTQLDELVFRQENIRLARDYGQVRVWADKLESDVLQLEQDLSALGSVRAELDRALAGRDADIGLLRARNQQVEASAADLQQQMLQIDAAAAERIRAFERQMLELCSLRDHLSMQLGEQRQNAQLLAEVTRTQAGEIAVMHQRINALSVEVAGMRVKAARYDRIVDLLPKGVLRLVRQVGRWWRQSGQPRRAA